jgi:hypothetical protein
MIMSGEIPPILLLLIIRTQGLLASHSVRTSLTTPLGLCVTLYSSTLVFFPPSYEMPHYSSEITIPLPPCPDILLSPFYRRCKLCEELVNVCLSCIFLFIAQKMLHLLRATIANIATSTTFVVTAKAFYSILAF